MNSDKDQKPELNPSQEKYEEDFNGGANSPDRGDTNSGTDFKYTPDEERNSLAEDEKSGNTDAVRKAKASAKSELMNYKADPDATKQAGIAQTLKSRAAARFVGSNRSKMKKRVTMGILGTFGLGAVAIGAIILFMLISGFGVKQAAIVAKGYGMYRLNRIANTASTRLLVGDVRVKAGGGLKAVTPSSAADKLRGFDIEKVMKNLESTEAIKYTKDPAGKVKGVVFNGGDEILIDGATNNPLKRADLYNNLTAKIKEFSPELSERIGLVGKTSDGIFERVGLKRIRWSEKTLAKLRKEKLNPKESLGIDQAQELEDVRGKPDLEPTGDPRIDAARDVADDLTPERAAAGIDHPVADIVPEQMDAIEGSGSLLSKSAAGELAEGASTVAVYTACTMNAVVESSKDTVKQNNDSSVRLAGKLQSASDQISSGATTAAGVGSARKILGENFADQSSYQKAVYNSDWKKYQQLPETDLPQPRTDKGWLSFFSSASSVFNSAWSTWKTSQLVTLLAGNPTWVVVKDWDFKEFCGKINDPVGGAIFGIMTSVLEHVIVGLFTGGTGEAATQSGKFAAKGLIGKVIEAVAQKAVLSTLKSFAVGKVESYAEKKAGEAVLRAVIKKMSLSAGKLGLKTGAEVGATVGLAYLVIKLADGSSGHTYTGTSDDQAYNKASAGTNVMQNDLTRVRYRGVPLDQTEQKAVLKEQYSTYLAQQKEKSFFARLININDPYSATARIAAQSPSTASGVKQLALNSINPLNIFNPMQNSFTQFAATSLTDHQAAYASSLSDVELANDGVEQWGYTETELELMKTEEYSLETLSEWQGTEQGKEVIQSLDEKYSECYETTNGVQTEMSDILLSETLKKLCLEILPSENKTNSNVLRWRLVKMDTLGVEEWLDLREITADAAPTDSSTPTGPGGTQEQKEDTSNMSCAAGGANERVVIGGNNATNIKICDYGSVIGINASWTQNVSSMLAAAKADGVNLAGNGYRPYQRQIELRIAHCGSSHYAIYEMSASSCRPPTARPGNGNHEFGLAIDFSSCSGGSTCFKWLKANAARFNIKNLPSETWHWSFNGS